MKFSSLASRVSGPGADAWDIHYAAIERQHRGEDIIVLSIGQEMLEPTPKVIIDAAVSSLNNTRHHYSEIGGEPDLKVTIAQRYSAQLGRTVSPANVAVMSGAQNALFAASLCTLETTDEAVIFEPYYATYPATFAVGGAQVRTVATQPERDFLPAIDDVIQQLTANTRAIVINSPHNPSGMVYPREFLCDLIEICRSNNIWLISDEVYAFFADPEIFCSPASLPGAFDHCITVASVSKSHRMTGWRVGWVIANEQLIDRMFNLSLCMSYGLPPFTQDAACAALAHSTEIEFTVRQSIDKKRNDVITELSEIDGIVVRGSRVGMFVTIDVRQLSVSANEFAWRLLDDYNIALIPCSAFGPSGSGILRINMGESASNLKIACERIKQLAAKL